MGAATQRHMHKGKGYNCPTTTWPRKNSQSRTVHFPPLRRSVRRHAATNAARKSPGTTEHELVIKTLLSSCGMDFLRTLTKADKFDGNGRKKCNPFVIVPSINPKTLDLPEQRVLRSASDLPHLHLQELKLSLGVCSGFGHRDGDLCNLRKGWVGYGLGFRAGKGLSSIWVVAQIMVPFWVP